MPITNKHNVEFEYINELISNAQRKVYSSINQELILLNWEIGKYITNKVKSSKWGDQIVSELADYIKSKYPNLKGFSKRGLYRMKQFYETYYNVEKVSPLVTQINWTNNLMILSKCNTIEEKQFYLLVAAKDKLSKRQLKRQIESGIFERTMLATTKVSPVVTQIHSNVNQVFKDTYVFEFLDLPLNYNEQNLQIQLLANLKQFLLELGSGFTFIAQEYRVQVGMKDFYIDLLFFHRELQCLVAIELKTTDFKPEYLGKMNFYLEALDSKVKKPNENPSIGILLCRGQDAEVVEITMRRNISPALIADYKTKLIDKELLRNKLHNLYEILDKQENL